MSNTVTITFVRSSCYLAAVGRIRLSKAVGFRCGVHVETLPMMDELGVRVWIAEKQRTSLARVHVVDDGTAYRYFDWVALASQLGWTGFGAFVALVCASLLGLSTSQGSWLNKLQSRLRSATANAVAASRAAAVHSTGEIFRITQPLRGAEVFLEGTNLETEMRAALEQPGLTIMWAAPHQGKTTTASKVLLGLREADANNHVWLLAARPGNLDADLKRILGGSERRPFQEALLEQLRDRPAAKVWVVLDGVGDGGSISGLDEHALLALGQAANAYPDRVKVLMLTNSRQAYHHAGELDGGVEVVRYVPCDTALRDLGRSVVSPPRLTRWAVKLAATASCQGDTKTAAEIEAFASEVPIASAVQSFALGHGSAATLRGEHCYSVPLCYLRDPDGTVPTSYKKLRVQIPLQDLIPLAAGFAQQAGAVAPEAKASKRCWLPR